jgi:hypothetical protein
MSCSPIGRRPRAFARTGWMPRPQTSGKPSFSSDSNVTRGRAAARKTAGLRRAHHAASGGQSRTNFRSIRTAPVCTVGDVTEGFEQSQYQVRFDWGQGGAAAAAFTGLANATGHLIGASTSGRAIAAGGGRTAIDRAIDLDSTDEVPVLREFSFDS